MRVQELLRHLEADGWVELRRTSAVRQLSHALRPGIVTIAGDPQVDIPDATLRSVFVPVSRVTRERLS